VISIRIPSIFIPTPGLAVSKSSKLA
jgi:hypothetical protein